MLHDWFQALADCNALPPHAARALIERGFVVLPGPVPDRTNGANGRRVRRRRSVRIRGGRENRQHDDARQ